jgi:hypothetical protein
MSNIEERAKISQVFYQRGVFYKADDSGPTASKKFAKAPFDIIQIEKAEGGVQDQYIVPTSCMWIGNEITTYNTNHEREGFGYLSEDSIVVGEHEMGAHIGGAGNWKDCFFLGHV